MAAWKIRLKKAGIDGKWEQALFKEIEWFWNTTGEGRGFSCAQFEDTLYGVLLNYCDEDSSFNQRSTGIAFIKQLMQDLFADERYHELYDCLVGQDWFDS